MRIESTGYCAVCDAKRVVPHQVCPSAPNVCTWRHAPCNCIDLAKMNGTCMRTPLNIDIAPFRSPVTLAKADTSASMALRGRTSWSEGVCQDHDGDDRDDAGNSKEWREGCGRRAGWNKVSHRRVPSLQKFLDILRWPLKHPENQHVGHAVS